MAFRKVSYTKNEFFDGKHRFEHWYRDNTVYFITSKAREGHPFRSDEAKAIFWDRFEHYSRKYGFVPWITTLMSNHYHTEGYLKVGENLGPFMQHFHGSVAKLTNDLLTERLVPFWRTKGNKDYFDGCIRDVLQATRAYRYTKLQAVRAGIVADWRAYPDTRVGVEIEGAIRRAGEIKAFLEDVPYERYERKCGTKKRGIEKDAERRCDCFLPRPEDTGGLAFGDFNDARIGYNPV